MTTLPPECTLEDLAERFATHRRRLHAIAYRALGSPWNADDAVQEVWLRLQRADRDHIENLEAWLTTVVARVSIDMIRQQVRRREDLDDDVTQDSETGRDPSAAETDPAEAALHADDLGLALQVVLDTLGPLERLALILHDVFALSYDEIAPIVERSTAAARQLASRARAKIRGVDVAAVRADREAAIAAFLDAARQGDFGALLQLLDPDIVLRSDETAVEIASAGAEHGAPLLARTVQGADAVARVFAGRADLARPVRLGGVPAAAYLPDGTVHAVYLVTFDGGRIGRLDVLADLDHLAQIAAG